MKTTQKIGLLIAIFFLLICFTQAELLVHFIDVGQGEAILIQTPNSKNILIDGGTKKSGTGLVNYLSFQGIAELDLIIATHPHEDHIGGLLTVFDNLTVRNVCYPAKAHTSVTFEQFINKVNHSGAKRIKAVKGKVFDLDSDIELVILSPFEDKDYESLNHYSVVTKLTYGSISFLFTGDCEIENEKMLLIDQVNLQAEVINVAHHGSSTSSSADFLKAVSPLVAIISVGKDNPYQHPHQEVLQRLKEQNVSVYRTDIQGNIILKSDGKNIYILDQEGYLDILDTNPKQDAGEKYKLENYCYWFNQDKKVILRKESLK